MRSFLPLILTLALAGCGSCDDESSWTFDEPSEQLPEPDAGTPDTGRADAQTLDSGDAPDAPPDNIPDAGPPVPELTLNCRGKLPQTDEILTNGMNDAIRFDFEIGPNGCPHIAWSIDDEVRYAVWTGEEWIRERVALTTEYEVGLEVDDAGVPTVYVATNKPGFVGLRREGGWTVRERLGERWTWRLSGDHIGGRSAIVLVDADERFSGTNMRLQIGVESAAGWSFEPIGDFDHGYLTWNDRIAVDPAGIGYLAFLENKGYGPNNRASNLWIARSSTPDLTGWTWERVGEDPYNRFRFPKVHVVDNQLQIVAIHDPLDGSETEIMRGVQDSSGWQWDTLVECPDECSASSEVDRFGRLHLLYGLRRGNGFAFTQYYRLGSNPASDVELRDAETSSALRVDATDGTAQVVFSERMNQVQPAYRQLRWAPLP